jgi:hypothetical protein
VRDQRTGKGGLLWEEGEGTVRRCESIDDRRIHVSS